MSNLGIDVGGTFTDFILFANNRVYTLKLLSDPGDSTRVVLAGIERLGIDPRTLIVNGTTLATNALLERKGARVALVTTKGFEDILEIGRQTRDKLYDLFWQRPEPLVPRDLRYGVPERMNYRGKPLQPLVRDAVRRLVRRLAKSVEAIAICLLFSYQNPAHEKIAEKILSETGLPISVSHKILPEYREYERTAVTVLNAYLTPKIYNYISKLRRAIGPKRLRIMSSSGGSLPASLISKIPVATLLSGPAGGVLGAQRVGRDLGLNKVISFDMGGTSTDVSLIDDQLEITKELRIGGIPVRFPMLDIHTIGAGGGSCAYFDPGGILRVGPQSAGARPGPICYDLGGKDPTVTDAHLILGHLEPERFFAGKLRLNIEGTRRIFDALATRKGMSPEELVQGILDVVNSEMERAIRYVSVQQGHDPKDFALIAFGGAGPLHACSLQKSLKLREVIVPRFAGLLSAIGLAQADLVLERSQSWLVDSHKIPEHQLVTRFQQLSKLSLSQMGHQKGETRLQWFLDMRYKGQSYELRVPWKGELQKTLKEFNRLHKKRYTFCEPRFSVEIVNLCVRVIVLQRKAKLPPLPRVKSRPKALFKKDCWFEGKIYRTAYYDRSWLGWTAQIEGPAIILEDYATTALGPGYLATVTRPGHLLIRKL